ncbi:transmembrane protease serine 9 [Plutella xylostella]|uniref:transmembrane protease serine 9 n=1 Tax=Plutella xylostella TaxID=51655 RepID=UPI002032FF3D|nr:transmembrane protease serine 9 [Plutella xylostella]
MHQQNFGFFTILALLYSSANTQDVKNETAGNTVGRNQTNTNDYPIFRIRDGIPAKSEEVPYQVSFKDGINFRSKPPSLYGINFCGGTLVQPQKILSAAHCFFTDENGKNKPKDLNHIVAAMGNVQNAAYYSSEDSLLAGQWRRLINASVPSNYKFPRNDIAVVFALSPFVLNSRVATIPYARRHSDHYQHRCIISGYGRINEYTRSAILLMAAVDLLSTMMCKYRSRSYTTSMICADRNQAEILVGDSGGPLVCRGTGEPAEGGRGILVGIASGGERTPDGVSFYTRISSYRDFIESKDGARVYMYSSKNYQSRVCWSSFVVVWGVLLSLGI